MLQIPEGTPTLHGWNDRKVIGWRRRGRGPFERPCVPRIRPSHFAPAIGPHKIKNETADGDYLKDHAATHNQVPDSPAAVRLIGVDPTRHPENAGYVHEVERKMEADHKKPKMPSAQRLIQHAAGHLGKPIVESSKDGENNCAYQDIVEVRDYEIRCTELPIERRRTQHDTGKTCNQKLKKKSDTKEHGYRIADLSAPKRGYPIEDLDAGGDGYDHRGERNECIRSRAQADGKHVMRPHAHADEADGDGRGHHGRIAENRFARKDRDDLVRKSKSWQDQDVNLGMTENPKEMHPEDGGSARLGVEEMGAEIAVDQKHDLGGRERADGDEHHAAHYEIEPHE